MCFAEEQCVGGGDSCDILRDQNSKRDFQHSVMWTSKCLWIVGIVPRLYWVERLISLGLVLAGWAYSQGWATLGRRLDCR